MATEIPRWWARLTPERQWELFAEQESRAVTADGRVDGLKRFALSAVLKKANDAYHAAMDENYDYPPFALTAWGDRVRWSEYLRKVEARELEEDHDLEDDPA